MPVKAVPDVDRVLDRMAERRLLTIRRRLAVADDRSAELRHQMRQIGTQHVLSPTAKLLRRRRYLLKARKAVQDMKGVDLLNRFKIGFTGIAGGWNAAHGQRASENIS